MNICKTESKDSMGTSILTEWHWVGSRWEVCFSLQGASHTPAYLNTGVRTEWIIGCVKIGCRCHFSCLFGANSHLGHSPPHPATSPPLSGEQSCPSSGAWPLALVEGSFCSQVSSAPGMLTGKPGLLPASHPAAGSPLNKTLIIRAWEGLTFQTQTVPCWSGNE